MYPIGSYDAHCFSRRESAHYAFCSRYDRACSGPPKPGGHDCYRKCVDWSTNQPRMVPLSTNLVATGYPAENWIIKRCRRVEIKWPGKIVERRRPSACDAGDTDCEEEEEEEEEEGVKCECDETLYGEGCVETELVKTDNTNTNHDEIRKNNNASAVFFQSHSGSPFSELFDSNERKVGTPRRETAKEDEREAETPIVNEESAAIEMTLDPTEQIVTGPLEVDDAGSRDAEIQVEFTEETPKRRVESLIHLPPPNLLPQPLKKPSTFKRLFGRISSRRKIGSQSINESTGAMSIKTQ